VTDSDRVHLFETADISIFVIRGTCAGLIKSR